ncbi:hypothetical protein P7K49_015058, partial [Saguinus oedipus]
MSSLTLASNASCKPQGRPWPPPSTFDHGSGGVGPTATEGAPRGQHKPASGLGHRRGREEPWDIRLLPHSCLGRDAGQA